MRAAFIWYIDYLPMPSEQEISMRDVPGKPPTTQEDNGKKERNHRVPSEAAELNHLQVLLRLQFKECGGFH